ncbi:MAG: YqcI/YcgG family protein [Methylococcales bacterium]|nr:YqcI/YcgG family protein [Methylococcales bacterium]MDP3839819.1 YqcI/YcgG family protein [Methylococcales bacterium]
MLSTNQLAELHPVLWKALNELFNSKDKIFPCLYAMSSFNKQAMYFGISNQNESIENLADDLKEMSLLLDGKRDEKSKIFNTYVHIIKNNNIENVKEFLISLLQALHKIDEQEWLENSTKDMNVPDFEFCFNSQLWFPVLLTPNHPSTIRRSPFTLIAFQPKTTFDYNKETKSVFYQRMRASIHSRVDYFYNEDRPYYLSDKSSGKNIVQFIGLDSEETKDFHYPKITNFKK